MQAQRERIVAAARSDAVEQETLVAVGDEETVDKHAGGVYLNAVGENLPPLVVARDVRGQNPQVDDPSAVAAVVGLGAHAHQPRKTPQGILESGRKLHAVLLGPAHDRKMGQVERSGVEVLGRTVDGERIAAVGRIDVQPRSQQPLALDEFRIGLERKLVAGGVEEQLQRRPVGNLQSRRHGVGHRIEIADIDRQERIIVGHGGFVRRGPGSPPLLAEQGQVFPGALAQVLEDGAVAGLGPERDVGEVRTQFDELAVGRILARDHGAAGLDDLVVVAVGRVGDADNTVQVVERPPSGVGLDPGGEHRHRIALIDVQRRQVGTPQVEREIVMGNGAVEVDGSGEIEIEVGVARRDQAVEPAVAQTAVEPERIVGIAPELQLRHVADDHGVGHSPAHRPVDGGGERRIAQQAAAAEQLAQPEAPGREVALQRTAPAPEGLHGEVQVDIAYPRGECGPEVERRKQAAETGVEPEPPGPAEHGGERGGQLRMPDVAGQQLHLVGRGDQPRNVQLEACTADVGQSGYLGRGRERSACADAHVAELGLEIGDRAGEIGVDFAEKRMPPAELRREESQVVGRKRRMAQGSVELHLADEILVVRPRIPDQRHIGNRQVRPGGEDGGLLEPETPADQVEPPRQAVEDEPAALARRKGGDGGVDGVAVDGEVVNVGGHVREVHVAEVDAVGGIAVLLPLKAQLHADDGSLAQREVEIAFLGTVGVRKPADDLPDVHPAVGGLAQAELGAGNLGTAEDEPAAENPEPGEVGIEPVDVKERIALVILDIETLYLGLAEPPDVDVPDGDRGFQLGRDDPRSLVHDEVLHGRNTQQQRQRKREQDDRQNDRQQHLSQYFYTFVHE